MKQTPFTVACAIVLGLLLTPGSAALADIAKAYHVELIIFSHMSKKSLNTEQWPQSNPGPSQYANALMLAPTISNQQFYRLLEQQDFTLAKEQTRLNKYSATYHTITHIAWRQQVFEPLYAHAVHITGGQVYNKGGQITPQVNGTIRVSVKRYFDVNFNLTFAAPAYAIAKLARNNYFDNAPNGLVYFHLLQTRRMRSDELNYIDFPLYGILIKITPVK